MRNRHEEIAEELRDDIATGAFPAGTALPSEARLAERFTASVPTVRLALSCLQNDGLIEKVPGNGNYVLRPFELLTYTNGGSGAAAGAGVTDGTGDGARSTTDRFAPTTTNLTVDVTTRVVRADLQLSAHLRVPAGTPLNMYLFLSRQGTSPHSLARIYVPHSVAELAVPQNGWSPLGDDIRALLADRGIQPATTVEHVTARLPEPLEERLLRIGSSTAVLAIRRRSMDAGGRVIEAAVLVLPGHRSEAVFRSHASAEEMETTT